MPEGEFLLPEHLGGPKIDLSNCAREPIHIPGSVQPHGVLLALSLPDLRIVQVSANSADLLGAPPDALLGQALQAYAPPGALKGLQRFLSAEAAPANPQYAFSLSLRSGGQFDATAHRVQDLLVVELERAVDHGTTADFYHATKTALSDLEAAPDVLGLCAAAAEQVRELTGFDRVMIYRFAQDDTGEVVAEARRSDLHSYLGQRFPESDVPRQARALYLKNWLRLTADVHAQPAPLVPLLNPVTNAPLDMSSTVLRSTSPIHVQYLKNMSIASSLSVSIVQDGRLWGLISCHHASAKFVPQVIRSACEFLGRVLSLQIAAKRQAETFRFRENLKHRHQQILSAVSGSLTPLQVLVRPDLDLPGFMRAGGTAFCFGGHSALLGETPAPEEVTRLVSWLRGRGQPLIATEALSAELSEARGYAAVASGVLGVSVTGNWEEYLLWFRPEIPKTITWGGDPHKPVEVSAGGAAQLTPRKSFQAYVEQVRYTSVPWHPGEVEEAASLRDALVDTIGTRLTALQELHAQLERTNAQLEDRNQELAQFAYVASHDLQEPLRTLGAYADILRHRYQGRQLDERADSYLMHISEQVFRARQLVRDVLTLSNVTAAPPLGALDLRKVWDEVCLGLPWPEDARATCGFLPPVQANAAQVRQLLTNLLGNAIKFRSERPLEVSLTGWQQGAWAQFALSDNGIGIAPKHAEKVFVMFQRLHSRTLTGGNGIGLAVCKKVVERHGGRIWIEEREGGGTVVCFTLPAVGADVAALPE